MLLNLQVMFMSKIAVFHSLFRSFCHLFFAYIEIDDNIVLNSSSELNPINPPPENRSFSVEMDKKFQKMDGQKNTE